MKKKIILAAMLLAATPPGYGQGKIALICQPACAVAEVTADNLSELVTHPALPKNIDWESARLSTPANDAEQQFRQQQILKTLTSAVQELQDQGDTRQAQRIAWLSQRLQALKVIGGFSLQLDPDWVRLKPENSPGLEGDYRLYLRTFPAQNLTLWNGTRESTPWIAGQQTAALTAADRRQPGIDPDNVTVIAPDGTVTMVPTGYWNRRYHEPQPGSQIWLNLQLNALSPQYQTLNQRIVQLLSQRTDKP
ncbi:capsule biosynthesis GfcC D2 domain-containing protein [Enterobacter asburiae]|uniref:capsule biosynthesis GfcC D2 domain-containing protein n=1 Tax=Enterobacter asburiae TaxID=61645 RepID=UPI0011D1C39D|nr:capsule biosynthesis GfcC D2 domain-containing protein [Enterobacter asburiae]